MKWPINLLHLNDPLPTKKYSYPPNIISINTNYRLTHPNNNIKKRSDSPNFRLFPLSIQISDTNAFASNLLAIHPPRRVSQAILFHIPIRPQ